MASFKPIRELTIAKESTLPNLDQELKAAAAIIKQMERRAEKIRTKIANCSTKRTACTKKRSPAKKKKTSMKK